MKLSSSSPHNCCAPAATPTKATNSAWAQEVLAALTKRTFGADSRTPLDTGPHDDAYFEALCHLELE